MKTQNTIIRMAYLFLASNEWGNETMQRIAKEYFDSHPNVDCLNVSEHGGWWLQYNRNLVIVGTANDCARLSDEANQWRERFKNARLEIVDTIRR